MKKLMLVIAPIDSVFDEYGKEFDWGWWQPLGLLSIATFIKENCSGVEIKVMDEQICSLKEIINSIKIFKPDVLGVSVSYFTYANCLELADVAKSNGAQIIFGGHYATSRGLEILRNRPQIDYVITEEGEQAMLSLLKGGEEENIPNLIWRKNGNIIKNSPTWIKLDELPAVDYSFIDIEKYFLQYQKIHQELGIKTPYMRPLTVSAQKGCRWREKSQGGCIYCSCTSPVWRSRSPKLVWRDIMGYQDKYNIDSLVFPEDDFLSSKEWVKAFFDARPEQPRPGIRFLFARPNIKREEVDILNQLHCSEIYLGIESGDDKCLKKINKGIRVKAILKTVELLQEYNISFICSLVLGAPGENAESLKKTLDLAETLTRYGASHFSVYPLVPVPGSRSWEMAIREIPSFKEMFEYEDHLDPTTMLAMWAEFFCDVSLDQILETIDKIHNLRRTQRQPMENWL